eukprot:2890644-Prymnesium_polylepis.1
MGQTALVGRRAHGRGRLRAPDGEPRVGGGGGGRHAGGGVSLGTRITGSMRLGESAGGQVVRGASGWGGASAAREH